MIKLLACTAVTMVFGMLVYLVSGSHLLAGVTGIVGGFSYAHALRDVK